jgi:hypothetical protein
MKRTGIIVLYLIKNAVTNWPGTLSFNVFEIKESRHNIAGVRRDVWFKDNSQLTWHGVQIGNFSQLCHCKRLKPKG